MFPWIQKTTYHYLRSVWDHFPQALQEVGSSGLEMQPAATENVVELLKSSKGKDLLHIDGFVFYLNKQVSINLSTKNNWTGHMELRYR